MAYIGKQPTSVPLTSADLEDSIVTSAKITDGTIALADLSATGTKDATTFLRGDNTFAEAGGGGKVLQVVQGTINSNVAINSTSFVSTGLNVNITPSASDSKILLIVNTHVDDASNAIQQYTTIYRDATNIGNGNQGLLSIYTDGRLRAGMNMSVLDSPATTSQINYEVYFRSSSAGDRYFNSENCLATIIAMEIGA